MTRDDAVSRLCDVYGGSFDITRCGEEELPLTAKMDFYVHNSKYVLSKKAKLWEANSFEYVYTLSPLDKRYITFSRVSILFFTAFYNFIVH